MKVGRKRNLTKVSIKIQTEYGNQNQRNHSHSKNSQNDPRGWVSPPGIIEVRNGGFSGPTWSWGKWQSFDTFCNSWNQGNVFLMNVSLILKIDVVVSPYHFWNENSWRQVFVLHIKWLSFALLFVLSEFSSYCKTKSLDSKVCKWNSLKS